MVESWILPCPWKAPVVEENVALFEFAKRAPFLVLLDGVSDLIGGNFVLLPVIVFVVENVERPRRPEFMYGAIMELKLSFQPLQSTTSIRAVLPGKLWDLADKVQIGCRSVCRGVDMD